MTIPVTIPRTSALEEEQTTTSSAPPSRLRETAVPKKESQPSGSIHGRTVTPDYVAPRLTAITPAPLESRVSPALEQASQIALKKQITFTGRLNQRLTDVLADVEKEENLNSYFKPTDLTDFHIKRRIEETQAKMDKGNPVCVRLPNGGTILFFVNTLRTKAQYLLLNLMHEIECNKTSSATNLEVTPMTTRLRNYQRALIPGEPYSNVDPEKTLVRYALSCSLDFALEIANPLNSHITKTLESRSLSELKEHLEQADSIVNQLARKKSITATVTTITTLKEYLDKASLSLIQPILTPLEASGFRALEQGIEYGEWLVSNDGKKVCSFRALDRTIKFLSSSLQYYLKVSDQTHSILDVVKGHYKLMSIDQLPIIATLGYIDRDWALIKKATPTADSKPVDSRDPNLTVARPLAPPVLVDPEADDELSKLM